MKTKLIIICAFLLCSCSSSSSKDCKSLASPESFLINSWTARYERPFRWVEWIVISDDLTFRLSDQRSGKINLQDKSQMTFVYDDESTTQFRYFVDQNNLWLANRNLNEAYMSGSIVVSP